MAEEIRAEMVANVWKVVVSAGDQVADGDTLEIGRASCRERV